MTPAKDYVVIAIGRAMGACELCGSEGISTRRAKVGRKIGHNSILECCNKCIIDMGLVVEEVRIHHTNIPTTDDTKVSGKGISGVDIMSKDELELATDFHSRIRIAREHRGLSQEGLAKQMNEKIGVIQKAENGIRPTDLLLNKFAKELGVKLFIEPISHSHTIVSSEGDRQMTISDVRNVNTTPSEKKKNKKSKSRRIGVSRSGARSRR